MLNQKVIEHDQEKYSLVLQINELYHIIHLTQQNLTNTIHQVKKRKIVIFFSNYNFLYSYQMKMNDYKTRS